MELPSTAKINNKPWCTFRRDSVDISWRKYFLCSTGRELGGSLFRWPSGGFNPLAWNAAEGQFGTYDFQRNASENTFYTQYTNASNFGVGVYLNGAGFSEDQSLGISWVYSELFSNVSEKTRVNQGYWLIQGWQYANRFGHGSCN